MFHATASMPVVDMEECITLYRLNPGGKANDDREDATRKVTNKASWRNIVAFWLLGLINNTGFVIMMAVAKDIAPGAVGVVFFVDVAPIVLVKLSAPYWFHLVPYSVRVCGCAVLMVLAPVTVAYGESTALQLLGVAFSSLQGGLGEASMLALTSLYDTPRALTAWSSGTGFAGIWGYAWVMVFNLFLGLSLRATLMMANLLVFVWLYAYFILLVEHKSPRSAVGVGINSGIVGESPAEAYSPSAYWRLTARPSWNDDKGQQTWDMGIEKEQEGMNSPWNALDHGSRQKGDGVSPSQAAQLTVVERLRFVLGLWRFMVPLVLVYFAEYTLQTGTWSAIGFPVTSASARHRFYEYANWSYQGGVFVSRSSGMIVRLSLLSLWVLPVLQLLLLLFFYFVAIEHFWYDNSLLFLCFGAGLIGGLGYVNAFRLVAEGVPSDLSELALAATSVGESFGAISSDIFGTFVQACVYKRNGIPGAWATC